jgi:hypothetical protein
MLAISTDMGTGGVGNFRSTNFGLTNFGFWILDFGLRDWGIGDKLFITKTMSYT